MVARGLIKEYKWQASITLCGFIDRFEQMNGCSMTNLQFHHLTPVELPVAQFLRSLAN